MKKLLFYLSTCIFLLLSACSGKNKSVVVNFEGTYSEQKWAITDLNPELPADWSSYEFLTFEINASSTQRFELKLYDAEGMRRLLIHPFQGAWVRASIPLFRFKEMNRQGFTMALTYQASLPGCWLNFHYGPWGSINHIDSIGIAMVEPIDSPTLEIRNIRLTMTPEDTIISPIPLVDEFGQWILDDWPGKAKTLDDLKAAWKEEEMTLQSENTNVSKYGGFLGTKAKATGFFRVEKIDGKWWFVDPEGLLFFSTGSNGIGPRGFARVPGREYIYTALPPTIPNQPVYRRGRYSFYIWNLYRRFGSDWDQKWIDLAVRRMDSWGLNTIGNHSDSTLCASHRKAYAQYLRGWGIETGFMGMPDVYAPDYLAIVDAAAASQCAPRKDDPYLLGYFIGNEPIWPGREQELANVILQGIKTPMQIALKKYLAGGDTPERRKEFVYKTFAKFISIVNTAIKKHDPNHLNLGLRYGGSPPDELIKASKDFDVVSLNIYGYDTKAKLEKVYDFTGLPIIIGEFHFGTPDRGLAPGLKQTINQEERAVAYRYYVENSAAHPALIGTHWFQWNDQPSTGRFDGENYNIGWIDVTDRPYNEMIDAAKVIYSRLLDIHSGNEAPISRKAITN